MSTYTRITAIIQVKGPIDEVYDFEDYIKRNWGGDLEILVNHISIAEVTESWTHKYETAAYK